VELVEQNRGLRRMRRRRQPKRLPHVHHRKPNPRALLLAEPGIKLAHARLRAVLAPKPDRPATKQIADHDPVAMAFTDRNLVHADHLRARTAHTLELGFHILLVECLDRVPVQLQLRRHILDCCRPTAPADIMGKSLGVERVVGQKIELFTLHLATAAAIDAPHLQLQENPRVAARQVVHAAHLAIVPALLTATATVTSGFFERRLSLITRAFGSPKTPHTVGSGRKPGKQYASHSRRGRFAALVIHLGCQIKAHAEIQDR